MDGNGKRVFMKGRFPVAILIVVDDPRDWPLEIPHATVVAAHTYLTDPAYAANHASTHVPSHSITIVNLCKSYRYQSLGYYVSLLAEARDHKPLPKVGAIEDLQSQNLLRYLTGDLSALIQRLLAPLKPDNFELGIYFGRATVSRYDVLSRQLFGLLPIPLLCARFERQQDQWNLRSVRAIAVNDIAPRDREFVAIAADSYLTRRGQGAKRRASPRFDLAILHDPDNPEPPSNAKAMQKFRKAAEELNMRAELITRTDISRLPEFDALFIRDTTFVNHYTYRFSRRAFAEGLVVIDEPDSILKCNNKVYLAELLAQHNIRTPRTLLVHRDNISVIASRLGLPCVLKQPDSSFSRGVIKVEADAELLPGVTGLLEKSALIIAQEWLPTEFDWRVGILDRRVIFVARYGFPAGHWQVIKRDEQQHKLSEGFTQAVAVDEAPEDVVRIALKSANLIGDGFYGVDIKQVNNRCYVIEVNDNPNVDAGNEDALLKDALYREVMSVFLKRVEARKRGHSPSHR
ncbi:Glutathione synthase/RimK-type ligase, ATP-grasp superfamily [Nitrosospira sp. Nl5]|nr:Glutathione synthase/RimK-type ligase, ATP-grasp superfamily [Nitrosospira sp. Nl5]